MGRLGDGVPTAAFPRYVLGFGVALGLVQLGELLLLAFAGSALRSDGQYLVGVVTTTACSIGIAYCGYWLERSGLSPDRWRRIARWGAGGTIVSLAVNLVLIATTPTESWALVVSWVRWAVAVGAGVGLLIGSIEGRAVERAVTAERAAVRTAQLEAQRDLLDYLNSVLRHEVLNSASIIGGYATVVLEGSALEDSDERWLRVVKEEAEDMSAVVDDVRVLLETTAGSHELRRVDLARVLTDEVRKLRNRHRDVEVETSIPEAVFVPADDLLPRVFGNLLSNAVEHNDASTPRVRIAVEPAADAVRVEVEDNGPGVPEGKRGSLFERDTDHASTHGLGLYLAAEVVEEYGGRLELTRTGSDGSLFTVELPRASADAVAEECEPRSDGSESG